MADLNKGSIVYLGDYGIPESHMSKSVFRDVTDAAALDTLATALVAYSNAVVHSKVFSAITEEGASAPGVSANMDVKAMIVMRDSDDGRVVKFLIPAPKDSMFEPQGQGDRVLAADLAIIAAAVNTATGKSYIALYGKKIQKT